MGVWKHSGIEAEVELLKLVQIYPFSIGNPTSLARIFVLLDRRHCLPLWQWYPCRAAFPKAQDCDLMTKLK